MTSKKFWFQLHWLLGITAGTILCIMALTGAMQVFQADIMRALNPGILTTPVRAEPVLTPTQLLANIDAENNNRGVANLIVSGVPGDTARVIFAATNGERRGETRYVDPYSGKLLGQPRGTAFYAFVILLHRTLVAGETGAALTTFSATSLLFMIFTGLYLRWPKNPGNWRAWLVIDIRRDGRSFLWSLHSVIGTLVMVSYLMSALTGLTFPVKWYRDALFSLTGAPRPPAPAPKPARKTDAPKPAAAPENASGPTDLDVAWRTFLTTVHGYSLATIRVPAKPGATVQITYLDAPAQHDRANNIIQIDPLSGTVKSHVRYAEKPAGWKLMASIRAMHTGSFWGMPGRIFLFIACLCMPLFAVTGWMLYLDRRRKKAIAKDARGAVSAGTGAGLGAGIGNDGDAQSILIAYGTQTGYAEELSWKTAKTLQDAGMQPTVLPLSAVTDAQLLTHRRGLFITSSFGDGEAPDAVLPFVKRMQTIGPLGELTYGVLALGDSTYANYCGFGKQLDAWLAQQGARPMFARIDVDRRDPAAITLWQSRLSELTGHDAAAGWQASTYQPWTLVTREQLNPGSSGLPAYHLELIAAAGTDMHANSSATWMPGDLVEIQARNAGEQVAAALAARSLAADTGIVLDGRAMTIAELLSRSEIPPANVNAAAGAASAQYFAQQLRPLPPRQYSIASISSDGAVHLLVRQVQKDGNLGIGSGWLTQHAPIGGQIDLRIVANNNFHAPSHDKPLILIGNGTGLAGLRSHLRARASKGFTNSWLIFGERQIDKDYFHQKEIEKWLRTGVLQRLDLAFSRDQAQRMYVQDRLLMARDVLRAWMHDGASIMVCGSIEGMAPGVHAALVEVLGQSHVERLIAEGRYLRDIY